MPGPAVFLDRDGTVIDEMGCLDHPDRVSLLPGAASAIRRLNLLRRPVVIVTNQAWVARGAMTDEMVRRVNDTVVARLAALGAAIDAVYFCPHHPTDGTTALTTECDCRKPKPGLLARAAADHDLDVGRSVVVGDLPTDISLAAAVGARRVLVRTGFGGALWDEHPELFVDEPDVVVDDLAAAVDWILRTDGLDGGGDERS